MNKALSTIVDSEWTVPALAATSGALLGVAAGVLLERELQKRKRKSEPAPEVNPHPRLFDENGNPNFPQGEDSDETRVVITMDDAIRLREAERDREDPEGYRHEWVDGPPHIPEVLAEKVASGVTPTDPRPENPMDPNPAGVPFNVLDSALERWNWDRETTYRDQNPEGPYPVHEEEFASADAGYHVELMLFYEADEFVCQEDDPRDVMYDAPLKLGDLRFGYGSTDPDVCYIRNPRLLTDFKITRMRESYEVAVMGLEAETEAEQDELAHMDRPLRMRRLE